MPTSGKRSLIGRRYTPLVRSAKNWDDYVAHADEVAESAGFQALRDRILASADLGDGAVVVDVGAGTGLLALAAAERAGTVWAVDVSPAMGRHLEAVAAVSGLHNVHVITASAVALPLEDASADAVVSNYCYHHLTDPQKRLALAEAHRVLRPGGRLVVGDMMFRVRLTDARDRQVLREKSRAMLRMGVPGAVRLLRNAGRYASRRWEHPSDGPWWKAALISAGFDDVDLSLLEHEGGVVAGRRAPAPTRPG